MPSFLVTVFSRRIRGASQGMLVGLLFAVLLPLRAMGGEGLTIEPAQVRVGESVRLTYDAQAIQTTTPLALELWNQGKRVVRTGPYVGSSILFDIVPTQVGEYEVRIVSADPLSDTRLVATSFVVLPKLASGQEIARGVLVLLVAGGVVIALTIGLIIFLRWPRRKNS